MDAFWSRPERLLDALVIGLAVPTIAIAATMTRAEYNAAKDRATAEYKAALARCDALAGNDKDVCVADAKAAERKAKAEADATFKNTNGARRDARVEMADADYDAAKTRCKLKTGNARDVCMTEAKAAATKAKAEAKARAKIEDARADAANDARDADYKVALERCDSLAGSAKQACVSDAKARFAR